MTPGIEQIRAREQAATPGPWEWATDKGAPDYVQLYSTAEIDEYEADILSADGGDVLLSAADADFIAHARTDIPALLAAIDELTAQRDAVLALHKEDGIHGPGVYCHHDLQRWPCETVRTLTNAWEKGTS